MQYNSDPQIYVVTCMYVCVCMKVSDDGKSLMELLFLPLIPLQGQKEVKEALQNHHFALRPLLDFQYRSVYPTYIM